MRELKHARPNDIETWKEQFKNVQRQISKLKKEASKLFLQHFSSIKRTTIEQCAKVVIKVWIIILSA